VDIAREVRFLTIQEFQKWYSNELVPKADSQDFINVPIRNIQGEYMVLRPASIIAIRVEPVFLAVWKEYNLPLSLKKMVRWREFQSIIDNPLNISLNLIADFALPAFF
jgi:hypothetical protein